jgi:hypothetical protein
MKTAGSLASDFFNSADFVSPEEVEYIDQRFHTVFLATAKNPWL